MSKKISLENMILGSLLTEKSVIDETEHNTVSIYTPINITKTLVIKAFKKIFEVDIINVRSSITLGKTKKNRRTGKKIYGTKQKKFFVRVDNIEKVVNKVYQYSNLILGFGTETAGNKVGKNTSASKQTQQEKK